MRWEWERRFGREGLGEKAWEEEKKGGRGKEVEEEKKGGEKVGRESKTVETKMYCTMQK